MTQVKKRPMRQPTFYILTEVKLVILNVTLYNVTENE